MDLRCAPGLAVKLGTRKFSRAKRLLGSKTSKSDTAMPPEEGKIAAEETMTEGATRCFDVLFT